MMMAVPQFFLRMHLDYMKLAKQDKRKKLQPRSCLLKIHFLFKKTLFIGMPGPDIIQNTFSIIMGMLEQRDLSDKITFDR